MLVLVAFVFVVCGGSDSEQVKVAKEYAKKV